MTNSATVKLAQVEWIIISRALEEYKMLHADEISTLETIIIEQTITHMAAIEKQYTR